MLAAGKSAEDKRGLPACLQQMPTDSPEYERGVHYTLPCPRNFLVLVMERGIRAPSGSERYGASCWGGFSDADGLFLGEKCGSRKLSTKGDEEGLGTGRMPVEEFEACDSGHARQDTFAARP